VKCPQCHYENREEAKFCKECGNKLADFCPDCGTINRPDSKYCDECGYQLIKPVTAPLIDRSTPRSYTPKHLKDKILKNRNAIEGERKIVTVLFADVANFTSISEKLDPETTHQIMDGCFRILMDQIHQYEGTVNQFTGDGVMALFGAPIAHEDHARRACLSALAIQNGVKTYAEKLKNDIGIEFKLRIGINTGPVIVGSIGDDLRLDYTAIGDTTNLASRMEGMARPGSIFVSENIYRVTKAYFEYEPLGELKLKGKEKSQKAYEIIRPSGIETRIEAAEVEGLSRFVGRKNSLDSLRLPYEKVRSGFGQVVGIVGEAGVGKSRLLLEFVRQLPHGDFTYYEGRCLHYGSSIIYWPILDILKTFFEIGEDDRDLVIRQKISKRTLSLDEKLDYTLSSIYELFSLKVDDEDYVGLKPKQKRERTFESLRDLFTRISYEKPLIIALEDLHWIDKTSEEFIDYLIRSITNCRIMILLLYRPEYSYSWNGMSYYNMVRVSHLGKQSSLDLLQAVLRDKGIAPDIKELVLNKSEGNPLFVEEFARSLIENGKIECQHDNYILTDKTATMMPETIQDIISARIDRLDENLKGTLQIASVIGREFSFRLINHILEDHFGIKEHLYKLRSLGFIYEKTIFPELEYIFKHALIQEVASKSLLRSKRAKLHNEIGNAIEKIYPDRLEDFYEILAYHYSNSDNSDKAIFYLNQAREKASKIYSHWEAFRYVKKALGIIESLPITDDVKKVKLGILRSMSYAISPLGFPQDSQKLLKEGVKIAEELGDKKRIELFLRTLALLHTHRGNSKKALEYNEQQFVLAENSENIQGAVGSAMILCFAYDSAGEYNKLIETARKTIALIERFGKESDYFGTLINLYSYFNGYCGSAMGWIGNFNEGESYCAKGLNFAIGFKEPMSIAFCHWMYGFLLLLKGEGRLAIKHSQKSIEYAEKSNWNFMIGRPLSGMGYGYLLTGDLKKARKLAMSGLNKFTEAKIDGTLSLQYIFLGEILSESGESEAAHSAIMDAIELATKNNEKVLEGYSKVLLGRILGEMGSSKIETAEKSILSGIQILNEKEIFPQASKGYLFLGELYLKSGQLEKAKVQLKKAETMFNDMDMIFWSDRSQSLLGLLNCSHSLT